MVTVKRWMERKDYREGRSCRKWEVSGHTHNQGTPPINMNLPERKNKFNQRIVRDENLLTNTSCALRDYKNTYLKNPLLQLYKIQDSGFTSLKLNDTNEAPPTTQAQKTVPFVLYLSRALLLFSYSLPSLPLLVHSCPSALFSLENLWFAQY